MITFTYSNQIKNLLDLKLLAIVNYTEVGGIHRDKLKF